MFSNCRSYRWILKRELNRGKKIVIFIGLNPSKASSRENDNTLLRILSFSSKFNYKSVYIINLFGLITKNPFLLKKSNDPVGKSNDLIIIKSLDFWSKNVNCDLWLGWGDKGTLFDRDQKVLEMIKGISVLNSTNSYDFKRPLAMGKSKKGNPRHPLYLPNGSLLRKFDE